MVNRRIWKVYITLCFILLCFINTCNGTSRMEIQPLKFTYTKSIHCPNNHRNCNGNEQIKSACRPVFGFQPYYQNSDIDGCSPIAAGYDDIYCPLCKYTNPLTALNSGALKDQSPLIFYNSTKMPVALFTLITYGDKGVSAKLQEKCIDFEEFTSAKNLDITKTINSSCYSLDYRISISCEEYFYGDKCDIECYPSKDNSTEHFICDENGTRICGSGWRGQNCTEVDYCSYSPCENNGTCHNISPYYECNCTQGFTGQNCTEVDYCSYSPCENNGTCHNISPSYECSCTPEFTGHNCTETTFTTQSIPTDEVPSTDLSPTLPVTTTTSIEKSTEQTHGEVIGNQQPTTTENTQNSFSTSTVQSTETRTSVETSTSEEIPTMSLEPSSTGCFNQHCSEESTVPTKKVTSVVSPAISTEQAGNKALPTTTVAIAGASGGGVILIAVIAVVCVIRLRKRNRELKKKFDREIKETDSNSFLRDNPIYGMSFPPAPNTKEYKKEGEKKEDKKEKEKKEDNKEEEKKLGSAVGNGYSSYL